MYDFFDFNGFAAITREKFAVIWPSTESTPPTEANISIIITEMYSDRYNCYSEVPIRNGGRVDLILVEKERKELIFCEVKSSKGNSKHEILSNIARLNDLSTESVYYYQHNHQVAIPELRRFIFQWSENEKEIEINFTFLLEEYLNIPFMRGVIECEDAPLYCLFATWPRIIA